MGGGMPDKDGMQIAAKVRLVAPDEIAQNFSGLPLLVISSALVAEAGNVDLGFDALFAKVSDGCVRLFRDVSLAGAETFTEIAHVPADVLAIVAVHSDAEQLRAVWA